MTLTAEEAGRIVQTGLNLWTENPEQWIELFTDDAKLLFPFAPEGYAPGRQREVIGRGAIAEYYRTLATIIRNYEYPPLNWSSYHLDGDRYFMEYSAHGTVDGKPYVQQLLAVITFQGTKVKEFREYMNPVVILEGTGALWPQRQMEDF